MGYSCAAVRLRWYGWHTPVGSTAGSVAVAVAVTM